MTQRAIEALRDVFGADVPENVLEGTLDLADWNLVEAVEDIYRGGDYAPVPAPATQLGALLLQLQGTGIYVTVEGLEVLTSRVGFDANAILNAYFEERDKQGEVRRQGDTTRAQLPRAACLRQRSPTIPAEHPSASLRLYCRWRGRAEPAPGRCCYCPATRGRPRRASSSPTSRRCISGSRTPTSASDTRT